MPAREGGVAALDALIDKVGDRSLVSLRREMDAFTPSELTRRLEERIAVAMLRAGNSRSEVRDRLVSGRGISRATAYRRIDAALSQRGPGFETTAGDDPSMTTTRREPR